MTIPAEYLAAHPDFTLTIDLKPRLISPHPLTNQHTLTVARGPIVYCVEDVDNSWVTDHFRSTYLSPGCIKKHAVTEKEMVDPNVPEERYVGITITEAAYVVDCSNLNVNGSIEKEELDNSLAAARVIDELKFVPYYYRANRGGRGMARVGLKQWVW